MRRGPKGLPLLGNINGMLRSPVEFIAATSARYDGLAAVRVPGQTIWLVSHPQAVKHVLLDRNKIYVRGDTLHLIRPLFGRGLATSDGEHWLKHRRMMQPAFHKERLQRLIAEMDAEITAAVAALPTDCEVRETMVQITQRVIVRTMFGSALGADAQRWYEALLALERHIARHAFDIVPRPSWLPTPDNHRFKRAIAVLNTLVYRLIDAGSDRGDLLDMLLSAHDGVEKMSREDVRDEVMTIFLAGHETTANTLSFALHRLGRDAEARSRVRDEARAGNDTPYIRAVIEETLRLYPPAWIFARTPTEDDVIFDERIAKGSLVLVSPYATHRRPDVFPDPEAFKPERFVGAPARPPFSYLPFGGGPHICIGNHFALAEAQLVLKRLFQRADVAIEDKPIRPVPTMTLGLSAPLSMRLA